MNLETLMTRPDFKGFSGDCGDVTFGIEREDEDDITRFRVYVEHSRRDKEKPWKHDRVVTCDVALIEPNHAVTAMLNAVDEQTCVGNFRLITWWKYGGTTTRRFTTLPEAERALYQERRTFASVTLSEIYLDDNYVLHVGEK